MAMIPPPADWADLDRTLDAFGAAGRVATWWWRDDDAVAATPALDRLLATAPGVPLALAVIPARADGTLVRRLDGNADARICQHGWNHWNHAPPGAPKAELGAHRPAPYVLGELARGWLALTRLFPTALAMLVPPHNRIARDVAAGLPGTGMRGLSTFGARKRVPAGLVQVNTHVDIMDWNTRAFAGEGAALGFLVAHLKARLAAAADPDEPSGVLSHHLAHDRAAWDFLAKLLARLRAHPAARACDPQTLFAPA